MSTPAAEPCITIFIGDTQQDIPQSRFLTHVWGSGLDSPCHVCGRSFPSDSADVLIRTIGFETSQRNRPNQQDITQSPVTAHPLRIFNRHLSCLQAKALTYVPISHAWHEQVSLIQQAGPARFVFSEPSHFDATRLVYQTTANLLQAVTHHQKPGSSTSQDVEIWQDYLSVPQWRPAMQSALIRSIPAIYGYPPRTAVHWDDVNTTHLSHAHRDPDPSPWLFMSGLGAITRSRWFKRMWVTLEYLQSNQVYIIGSDLLVFEIDAARLIRSVAWSLTRHEAVSGVDDREFIRDMHISWSDMEDWKARRRDGQHTLGGAVYIMGLKRCRDFDDYFVALGAMMGFTSRVSDGADSFARFYGLVVEALRAGDYSPLLFNRVEGETPDPRAPWVKGYSRMSPFFFDLGVCRHRARLPQIIRGGRIQPELEFVGVIEAWDLPDVRRPRPDDEIFCGVASSILEASGFSGDEFYHAVNRIYPDKKMKGRGKPVSHEACPKDTYNQLFTSFCNARGQPERLDAARKLMSFLKLDDRQNRWKQDRLYWFAKEARWYLRKHGRPTDGLARVRCPSCGKRFLFRLNCWTAPSAGAKLYRIPGLVFDNSIPDGLGIVMLGSDIIGKAAYASPACGCRRLEKVYIGDEVLAM